MPIAMTRYLPKGSVFFGTTVEFFDMFWKVLSGNQIKILGALARNQSMDTGHPARLSISRIAKMCGMTRRTTGLGMEGLVSMGLVLPKDGAYYLQILTLDQASDALKRTDVIRNCSPDLIEKCSHSRSKTAQFGTKTRAETAHILREEEEEKVEERGQEPPALAFPGAGGDGSGLRPGGKLLQLPSSEPQIPRDLEQDLKDKLLAQEALAIQLNNFIVQKSYYRDPSKLQVSWVLKGTPGHMTDLCARVVLLTITNTMIEVAKQHDLRRVLPRNNRELEAMGDVAANVTMHQDWDQRFRAFYRWVCRQKDDLVIQKLDYYYSDWKEALRANG